MLNALILLLGIVILVASIGFGILLPAARTAGVASPRNVTPGKAAPVRGRHVAMGVLGSFIGGLLVIIGFAAGKIPTIKANYLLVRNIDVCGQAGSSP